MNMKTALIGSFAAAAALVAVTVDANARSWHYRTACGPSATIIKHHRYGFVGGERDYGVRSRTYTHGERYGARGASVRYGVRGHERGGVNVNVNARVRGGEDRTRLSGTSRSMGGAAGTSGATGRSVSPSGSSTSSGAGASSGGSAKTGGGGGAGLGTSGGASGSAGGGMSSGGGGGGSR